MLDAEELLHLAIHASSVGRHHACLTYLGQVLEQQPSNGKAIYLLAIQHAELGLRERAISGMKYALALEPALETARLQLGLLLMDRDRLAEAKEHFSNVGSSADPALRSCAEAMIAVADSDLILAREKLAAGLSHNSSNRALSALMQRLLDELLKERGTTVEAKDERVHLGAYRESV
jgi:tetratricopeptide (TPR) repeat protein